MLGIYKKFQKSIELTNEVRRNLESGYLQVPRGQWFHIGPRRWRYNGLIKLRSGGVEAGMLPPRAFVKFCKEDNQRCRGFSRSNLHSVALKSLEGYTPHTPEPTPRKFTARERVCLNMTPAYILTLLVSLWIS